MKTRSIYVLVILLSLAMTNVNAQKVIKLWDTAPPTDNELTEKETIDDSHWIRNVSSPELTICLPEKPMNTGMAVVVCPGGGYAGLASMHEGTQFAEWLNKKGITAFILKYRMPNGHKYVPLEDAWQALRYVREHASELNINPHKIGIAGFSAGGHLASTVSTRYATTGTSTRPDFSILFYPVITMGEGTHQGSKNNLLGKSPASSDLYIFSNDTQVGVNTPPTILLLSDDDKSVPPVNSIKYYDALKKSNVPATMYIFPEGGHGWGMRDNFKYHQQMLSLLEIWLKDMNEKLK